MCELKIESIFVYIYTKIDKWTNYWIFSQIFKNLQRRQQPYMEEDPYMEEEMSDE